MRYEEFLTYIKENIPISDVVKNYTALEPKGAKLWGLSPFKEEKTPSFCIDEHLNRFYCFSTNQGGDTIRFLMLKEGYTFKESIEYLSQKFNFSVEWNQGPKKVESYKFNLKSQKLQLYKDLIYIFSDFLHKNKDVLEYIKNRAIDEETIKKFQVGFCPPYDELYKILKEKGYDDSILENSDLFSKNKKSYSIFGSRLMFPIFDVFANPVAFGGRIIKESKFAKYLNSQESDIYSKRENLYGFYLAKQEIKSQNLVYISEGYLDVLSFYQAGIKNAVAPLGTALTQEQIKILKVFTNNIVLVFDSDIAGENATLKSIKLILEQDLNCYVLTLPPNSDPNDIINSDISLQDLVKNKKNFLDFLICYYTKSRNIDDDFEKSQILDCLFDYIGYVKESLKDNCLKQIAKNFNFYYEDIEIDYKNFLKKKIKI